jgi:ubiquinone/menaquinone biosynthesis C-methylase UbiE
VSVDRSQAFTAGSVPEAYARYLGGQLFEPWAHELLGRGGPWAGAAVLDVACGPGTVARIAAAAVGERGEVTASDISPAMLEVARRVQPVPESAPIDFVQASALELPMADGSFQFVLCQQGLQFFGDQPAAVAEFARVLGAGGLILASVWAAGRPLGLFGPIAEALRDSGLAEPYPRAFEPESYLLDGTMLRELFAAAGFAEVTVEEAGLECRWPSATEAARAVYGTPFGPLVSAVPPAEQETILARIRERLGDGPGPLTVRTYANVVRGVR